MLFYKVHDQMLYHQFLYYPLYCTSNIQANPSTGSYVNFDTKFSVHEQNFKWLFLPFHFCKGKQTLTRYSEEMIGGITFKPKYFESENT